jgi:prepilin-type N-terminal cleavage/methylation domain-containing protein
MNKFARKVAKALRSNHRGFTLIELLVVIGILAIIGGIVILNVGRFISRGCTESARIELHNIQTGAIAYMAEHGGTVPTMLELCTDVLVGTPTESELQGTYTIDASTGEISQTDDGC